MGPPPSYARKGRWILCCAAWRLATARAKKGRKGMASLTTELAEILHTVQRPGDFYTTGTTDIFAPRLDVAGVGPIALPLLPVQAQQLLAVAEQIGRASGRGRG